MTEGAVAPAEDDIRPVVARPSSNRAPWVFGAIALGAAAGLFAALEARRSEISSPAISAPAAATSGEIAPPPALSIPPEYPAYAYGYPEAYALSPTQREGMRAQQPQQLPPVRLTASRASTPRAAPAPDAPMPSQLVAQPAPNYDAPIAPQPGFTAEGSAFPTSGMRPGSSTDKDSHAGHGEDRVRAARFANPATTVPQGTVMHAVLETALDSSRAGFARAIVSRNVSSFDGSRILIPKGSKLFGEYQADVSRGQNRALIRWRRLLRPDGTIIDVDSPSADPLGRAGVKGKVNSHFLERFSSTILQSALDLGVQLAARKASRDTYILALPYGTREINPVKPEEIKPTLTVRQGTSVSVFIARDLDFTDVE